MPVTVLLSDQAKCNYAVQINYTRPRISKNCGLNSFKNCRCHRKHKDSFQIYKVLEHNVKSQDSIRAQNYLKENYKP